MIEFYGGRSSAGRAPDCDSGCRGFEPHRSPQLSGLLCGNDWVMIDDHIIE